MLHSVCHLHLILIASCRLLRHGLTFVLVVLSDLLPLGCWHFLECSTNVELLFYNVIWIVEGWRRPLFSLLESFFLAKTGHQCYLQCISAVTFRYDKLAAVNVPQACASSRDEERACLWLATPRFFFIFTLVVLISHETCDLAGDFFPHILLKICKIKLMMIDWCVKFMGTLCQYNLWM